MTPQAFKEQNEIYAKDQEEYLPLPAFANDEESISCWRLTLKERISILVFGRLWIRQMNFGKQLQPIRPQTEFPFAKGEA